ncbi:unnamed protein product [Blepharisma stoltei]|uniref:Calponin-homology (CH) domain-containing protein n=1 Tax=Blepharisma stoltei TaxID=1481888 RepID=A0AAU9I5J5_9CILI|nr:unnamed protein product [Blepharisma stoltei]
MDKKEAKEILSIIDWINSQDIPGCALVDTLDDLKSGIIVGDIVAAMTGRNHLKDVQRRVSSKNDALNNWSIIIKELSTISSRVGNLNAEDIFDNPESLKHIMKIIINTNWQVHAKAILKSESESQQEKILNKQEAVATQNHTETHELTESSLPSKASFIKQVQKEAEQNDGTAETFVQEISSADIFKSFQKHSLNETSNLTESQKSSIIPKNKLIQLSDIQKANIISWIEELRIVKKGFLDISILPEICRTGVILCDIINRNEGKQEAIKGIERHPRNKAQVTSNISKVLEYLRSFPRMSAKFLWSNESIINGDEIATWGILEDIKNFYCASRKTSRSSSRTFSKLLEPPKQEETTSCSVYNLIPELKVESIMQTSNMKSFHKSRSYAASARSKSTSPEIVSSRLSYSFKNPNIIQMTRKSFAYNKNFQVSEEVISKVKEWLMALNLDFEESDNIYIDTIRNGVTFCQLLYVVEGVKIIIKQSPSNTRMVIENFYNVLNVFISKGKEIPKAIRENPQILAYDPNAVWTLFAAVMSCYPTARPLEYQNSPLQYGAIAIKKLEASILEWLRELKVLPYPSCSIRDVMQLLKKGKIFCEIASLMTSKQLSNVIANPKTSQSSLSNIRKALDVFRRLPNMSQRYTWNEKEIASGNQGIILGLLEDIHMCYDGQSARKKSQSSSVPYIGKSSETRPLSNKKISFLLRIPKTQETTPLDSPRRGFQTNRMDLSSSRRGILTKSYTERGTDENSNNLFKSKLN